jgi:hypothetical protein
MCKEEGREACSMLMDIKIRWNSLHAMLKRYTEMQEVVHKTLVIYEATSLILSPHEVKLVKQITDALDIVECGSLALGKRDCDLVKADKIFAFVLKNLSSQDSQVARQLHAAIKEKVHDRRNPLVSGLLNYLSNPELYFDNDGQDVMSAPARGQLEKSARDIYLQLFAQSLQLEDDNTECVSPEPKKSKFEELRDILHEEPSFKPRTDNTPRDVLSSIKKEMAVYELTGSRPSSLEKLYQALLTIPPTSVEAERVFSATGLFITKLRTRLDDNTVDKLCFLRSYFQSKKDN